MTKPLNKEEYWAKIVSDLKQQYGYSEENSFDVVTIDSFKVMFDMGWDLHQYTQTNDLPENMHQNEEIFIEFPCVFEKLYDKNTYTLLNARILTIGRIYE